MIILFYLFAIIFLSICYSFDSVSYVCSPFAIVLFLSVCYPFPILSKITKSHCIFFCLLSKRPFENFSKFAIFFALKKVIWSPIVFVQLLTEHRNTILPSEHHKAFIFFCSTILYFTKKYI